MSQTIAPFGSWKSPLTTDVITEKTISIAEVIVDAATSEIYHVEERPHEAGRRVLVHSVTSKDVFGENWNARTGVHEYGGSAATVHNDTALFADWKTRRVYICKKQPDGWEEPRPVTPENQNHRFGELQIHPTLSHLVVCILEDHTKSAPADVVNTLVLLDINTQSYTTLAKGADFYAFGRFSPDGTKLAWVQWWHPDMPWEGSELYVASLSLSSTSLSISDSPKHIAGARNSEAVTQPTWSSPTKLVFLSDKTGFFNHYIHNTSSGTTQIGLGQALEQDFADPAWVLATSNYAVLQEDTILVPGTVGAENGFLIMDLHGQRYSFCGSPYLSTSQVRAIPAGSGAGGSAVFVGTGDAQPPTLIRLSLLLGKPRYDIIKETTSAPSLPALQGFAYSKAQAMTFEVETGDGKQANSKQPLHVIFYAPISKDFSAPEGEKPPCVINVHGGPTSSAAPGLKWLIQYWTSRGWAWVDVNYGGSSGYGRAYRERLEGKWGITDVDDCVSTVAELDKAGLVDAKRVAIRGGSAGGFTTLAALVKSSRVYAVGTSSYGVSDLKALEAETHKFESHYLKKLLGGSYNEIPEVYEERSPLTHAENITAPLLILQGGEDAVVPPNQAELMENKIESHGGQVKYKLFPEEGHGWRRSETIKEALELEISWYGQVLNIDVKP
ncbi:Dipeptidyl peptidase family member 6 [Ceratobasidium theobromae]|uniref:Dipeptidyl peptidase family member 6 n=1 Tax=Ceratobasidium theobromae TaxID=1582974 RepID=A0A5N5QEW7_9AGAM|nr:Dipeptidyl peptidase family member 6 [Ceratobasidium theobromae]